jgi:phosphoribosylformylglycinamidine synthase
MAGLDNFCWCDPVKSDKTPDGEYKLAQLVRANRGLFDITTAYGIPMISGKDSMKNDYMIGDTKISIPPTVLFSIMGRIEDITKSVTMDAKSPGDFVYVLGLTRYELGGSEYFTHHGFTGNSVPIVDEQHNLQLYRALYRAIQDGLVESCHDLSDGGLGTALAEVAIAGDLGMEIDLEKVPTDEAEEGRRDDYLLFSESQGRFVVTVKAHKASEFEKALSTSALGLVGTVVENEDDNRLIIQGCNGATVVDLPVDELRQSWKRPLMF